MKTESAQRMDNSMCKSIRYVGTLLEQQAARLLDGVQVLAILDVQKSLSESPAMIVVPDWLSMIQYKAVTSGLALTSHVRMTFIWASIALGWSQRTTGESVSAPVNNTTLRRHLATTALSDKYLRRASCDANRNSDVTWVGSTLQQTQLSLTNRATRLDVSQGHQTWYHSIMLDMVSY